MTFKKIKMKASVISLFFVSFLFTFLLVMTMGCRNSRNVAYFGNIVKDTVYSDNQVLEEYVIRPHDLLNITCATMDEDMTRILNGLNTVSGGMSTNSAYSTASALSMTSGGYLVNKDGEILYPFIGSVKVAGLTKKELADSLHNFFIQKQLLNDAIFDIRLQNYRITILGEVNHPSVIIVPNEKITLPEALGLAGDLTIYGKRENILIVREQNHHRFFAHINLNTDSIFKSDFYYLRANDLVYVEPKSAKKVTATSVPVILPLVFSAMILFIAFLNYLK